MNGRIYDPLLGRFLSADKVIQYPSKLQSYNRYSYVRNNPLTLYDPDGYRDSPSPGTIRGHVASRERWKKSGGGDIYKGIGEIALGAVPWVGDAVGTVQDLDAVATGGTVDKVIAGASITLNAWTAGGAPGLTQIKNGGKSIWKGVRKIFGKGAGDAPNVSRVEGESIVPDANSTDVDVEAPSTSTTGDSALQERYVNESGGRWGGTPTRLQNDALATSAEDAGSTVTGGAGRASEEWIPGPDGGTKGGTFVDMTTVDADGNTVRVQTVTTMSDGVTPTASEQAAADRIRNAFPDDELILEPKW